MAGLGWGLTTALQSRVARRVAGLFVAAALVPMAGLAAVTMLRTSDHLAREAAERLRYDVKTVMMEALGRIELLGNTLQMLGTTLASGAPDRGIGARVTELFETPPTVLTYLPERGTPMIFGEPAPLPDLDLAQQAQLIRGRRLIVPYDEPGRGARDLLYIQVQAAGASGIMVAAIDYAPIFGLDQLDPLPPNSEICVFARGRTLVCSPGAEPAARDEARLFGMDEDGRVESPSGVQIARSRAMPLFAYAANPWNIVMMRPASVVRGALDGFIWDFWKVLALSVLVVSLVTVSQVRRQLKPLVELTDGTRRLRQRDFATPVRIVSGDEFEELGAAFNQLAGELQEQFAELEAFSLGTLETLARTIDAKSPWTGGHSERVTEFAVELALEMDLPEEEVTQLRRGGLVHDIGKLATPQEILDKPDELSPQERRIMQNHAQQGVHILEPITAFRPLLPIVGQHHEWWNGAGYPNGISRTEIARTARVLAVSDVFDAMRSDRPYRAGLPLTEVIEAIRDGSGSQFDPDVVAAFSRVISRNAERWGRGTAPRRPAAVTRAS